MKTFKEFITFTNLKGQLKNFIMLLVLTSFLYCSAYTILAKFMYQMNLVAFYLISYALVILASFVYLLVIYQFVKTKRELKKGLDLKACSRPLLLVQSLFFFMMFVLSLLGFYAMMQENLVWMQYILYPIMILTILFYIPWQFFAFLYIIDGEKKPLMIMKLSLKKMMNHYQSVFYSFIVLAALAFLYFHLMDALFQIHTAFIPVNVLMDIMLRVNPFLFMFEFMGSVFDNASIVLPVVISFVYGVLMCIVFCYYAMAQICIFDENIKK